MSMVSADQPADTSAESPPLAVGNARREKSIDVGIVNDELRCHGYLLDSYREVDGGTTIIHHMVLDCRVALPSLEIVAIEVQMQTVPFSTCQLAAVPVHNLLGLSLSSGFTREVLRRVGGHEGCTHLTALVLELSAAAVLHWFVRIRGHLPYTEENRREGMWAATGMALNESFVGVCHGWASDGEVVNRARNLLLSREPSGIVLIDDHSSTEGRSRRDDEGT